LNESFFWQRLELKLAINLYLPFGQETATKKKKEMKMAFGFCGE